MELLDDRPRLPKLSFIVVALVLLAVTAFLAATADNPPSTASIVGIIVCVGVGVTLTLTPFLADFARHEKLQVDQRQHALESMARSNASATEQASIAASDLNEIAETTKQNFQLLDELPEKISAAQETIERKKTAQDAAELEQLKAEIKKLQKIVEAQSKATAQAIDKAHAELKDARAEIQKIAATPAPESKIVEATPAPKPKKKAPRAKKTPPPPPVEASLFGDTDENDTPPQKPPSPQLNDEPKVVAWAESPPSAEVIADEAPVITSKLDDDKVTQIEDEPADVSPHESAEDPQNDDTSSAAAPDETPVGVVAESVPSTDIEPEPATADVEPAQDAVEALPDVVAENSVDESAELLDAPAPEEPALSSDGMTRLTVTAYIGIGNRLFIRGDGPGMSLEEGTPLQFVSIGKWRWETDAATAPVKATLWKNDEELCSALGEIDISPGAQMETSANF